MHEPPKEEPGGPEEHTRELTQLFPEVWAEDHPPPTRLAKHQAPVIKELKPRTMPVRKRQYPLLTEAWVGILPHINRLKQVDILAECQSAWNTPILSVKKEGGQDYRPVQDLRLVNQATVTLHPTVPNPYTLLRLLLLRTKVYTCLDLKDAFFSMRLAPASQPIFALNGKIQSGAPNNSSPGLPLKGLRTPQPSLGKPWLLTWTHSIRKSMDVGSYNTGMTCCWLPRPRENVGKGQKHCSSC